MPPLAAGRGGTRHHPGCSLDRRHLRFIMQIALKPEHWEKMLVHVQAHAPLEACGLLAGRKSFVEDVLLIENEARSPNRFRMDPKQQLKAFHWMPSNGLQLLGIFHSHPPRLQTPSHP